MTLSEEIIQHIQALPESLKSEVLDFIEYLELKHSKVEEEIDWSALSLSSAMSDMEKEPILYSIADLKEHF